MNINLNNQWRVHWTQENLSFAEFHLQKKNVPSTSCSVPNQFVRILQETLKLPDPYMDGNYADYLEYEHHHLWFEYHFNLEEGQIAELHSQSKSPQAKIVNLIFDGIDTLSEIYFNNKPIGHTENMFIPWKFRITDLLQPGMNSLVVHILPLPPENKTSDPNMAITMKGWAIRKAQHMFGWDILPRLLSGGIFQPVRIVSESIPEINSSWIETINVQSNNAILRVGIALSQVDQKLLDAKSLHLDLKYTLPTSTKMIEIQGIMKFNPMNNIAFYEFTIFDPILWYPHSLGTPALYSAVITIGLTPVSGENNIPVSGENKVGPKNIVDLYKKELKFGIRKITFDVSKRPDGGAYFRFLINNQPLFVLGTNWVPLDALHLLPPERQIQALEMAEDLGCNMIRVWGGGVYPLTNHEEFYSWCDSHGILIWQDFMMACGIYEPKPEFVALLETEIPCVMNQIRGHPSLFFLAGDNENESDKAYGRHFTGEFNKFNPIGRTVIPQLLQKIECPLPYIPSSPYNPDDWTDPSNHMAGDCHLWHHGFPFTDAFYFGVMPSFISEIGHISLPNLESIKKFLSPNEIGNLNSEGWTVHFGEVPPLLQFRKRFEKTKNSVKNYFSIIPSDLEDLICASQFVQAEAYKYWIEMTRVHQDICRGILWWNLLDGWPQCSDAIVDYFLRKKYAYSVIKCSQQKVLPIVLSDNKIWIANNSTQRFKGKLSVELISRTQIDLIPKIEIDFDIECNQSLVVSEYQKTQVPLLLIMKVSPSNPELPGYYNYKIDGGNSISLEDYQNFVDKLREKKILS